VSITELLSGKKLAYPQLGVGIFKKAPRQNKTPAEKKQRKLKEIMLPYTTD
jgi:hypothetical protein